MSEPILSIRDLVAGYGKLAVLHGVTLDLQSGEMLSVIGPNGAGKTSLTRAIMNLCTVSSGEIRFSGRAISKLRTEEIARLGVGYVPQTLNVFRQLSVQENLEMSSLRMSRADQKWAIDKAYEQFPRLKERQGQMGSSLSGGERQMLAIASALLPGPQLIILDEPVTGLSPSLTDEVARGIARINQDGVSVLWVVEENPQQIIGLSDSVVVMSGGTIRLRQTAQEMLANENFREIFLGV